MLGQRLRRIVQVQSISVSYREIEYYFPEISWWNYDIFQASDGGDVHTDQTETYDITGTRMRALVH